MRRKIWQIKEPDPQTQTLARNYNLHSILVQLLINRGLKEPEFNYFLKAGRHDFYDAGLLPDIEKAKQRVKKAVLEREKVLVFGDYDVDGVVSLVIFHEYAKNFPGIFSFYIPHRVKEGYGLNQEAVSKAKKEGVSLIIAFDCGTTSLQEIKLARSWGIDIIVIDHHSLKDEKSLPFALVNPKRKDSPYPFSDLSAGALSFKFLQVLTEKNNFEVLDLVALSLICDVVPLCGENRALLKEGLSLLKSTKRLAIKALCEVCGIRQENIDTFHVGYILGPRINASGRVAHAQESFDLFLAEDESRAYKLAGQLSEYNQLRKNIETQILKEAEQHLQKTSSHSPAIVVSGENWHPGVLGIVASRLADKYSRPSFVFSFDNDIGKGSCRSIQNVHILEMLDKCAGSLIKYGGHRKAAGVHINKGELENFKERINLLIKESLTPQDFIPVLDIDSRLSFRDIDIELVEAVENLKPYGEGNPAPLFSSSNILKRSSPRKIGTHFSVWLSDGETTLEGMVYDKDVLEIINYAENFDLAFSLGIDSYHNMPRLVIRDCRFSQGES